MEDVQNKMVTLTQEEYDAIIERLEKMENKRDDNLLERLEKLEQSNVLASRVEKLEQVNNRPDVTPPVFSGNNAGLSVPYTPAPKKKSGWETFGKMALGGAVVAAIWGIASAIGGGNSGGGNTFGGDMPM